MSAVEESGLVRSRSPCRRRDLLSRAKQRGSLIGKVAPVRRDGDSIFESLFTASLEISGERDKTEREIKRLAEAGKKEEAWKLLVKHLDIKEPKRLRAVK